MTTEELSGWLEREMAAFPSKSALLMAEPKHGKIYHAIGAETKVVAASTIKVPVLCCALELCGQGKLTLEGLHQIPEEEICDDTAFFEVGNRNPEGYPLRELLYWMIVSSDNTATNALIRLLGMDTINDWCSRLGLQSTVVQRVMLDWKAIEQGRNNYTSLMDQFKIYSALWNHQILNDEMRACAMDILLRQRSMSSILRYISDPVLLAHKTGGLDYLDHDAGLFLKPNVYFLGIFTWDGPSQEGDTRQKQLIGRLSKAVYETYREAIL